MGVEERLKILRLRYPEFEPLAKEFVDLQPAYEDLQLAAAEASALQKRAVNRTFPNEWADHPLPLAVIKQNSLKAYLGALAMYFATVASPAASSDGAQEAMPPTELRDHPIMETLVQNRDLWSRVKDIVAPEIVNEVNSNSEEVNGQPSPSQLNGKALEDSLRDQLMEGPAIIKSKKSRKTKAQKAAALAEAQAEARQAARVRQIEEDLAKVSTLAKVPEQPVESSTSRAKELQAHGDDDSDFGEQTALTSYEAQEKAKKKKGLRFHTSRIAQKANKRDNAGRDAGGDADIPHRERLKDRQARLNAEAEKRGKKNLDQNRDELIGELSDDDEDRKVAAQLREEDDEDYYDFVKASKKSKRADRGALYLARRENLDKTERFGEEDIGEDGKRGISYQIEKNKGLAAKKNKANRNPRVKKRNQFAAKKKKMNSIRPPHRGGQGKNYGGEMTGIKTGLVRSVKL